MNALAQKYKIRLSTRNQQCLGVLTQFELLLYQMPTSHTHETVKRDQAVTAMSCLK